MTASTIDPLTKVSANFTERAMIALAVAAEVTGDTHTDCLNRAIQVYALVVRRIDDGGKLQFIAVGGEIDELELP